MSANPAATARRPHKKHEAHEEEHESSERWLLTYADMITLLMVLFIVLFAVSQVDQRKFAQLHNGLASAFDKAQPVNPGGSGILDGGRAVGQTTSGLDSASPAVLDTPASLPAAQLKSQMDIEAKLEQALKDKGLQDAVAFRNEQRGLVVSILTDKVLFDAGSDSLRSDGHKVLETIVPVMKGLPNAISVEGHTDSTPVSTAQFPSNWELSVGRATTVLRTLLDDGMPADRLQAAGYADTRPIAPDDAAHRSRNRRVEIVILSSEADDSATTATPVSGSSPSPAASSPSPAGTTTATGALKDVAPTTGTVDPGVVPHVSKGK